MVSEVVLSETRQEEAGRYAWIIDTDHTHDPELNEWLRSRDIEPQGSVAGTTGGADAPADLLAELGKGKGVRFRMFADGDVAYEGRIIAEESKDLDKPFWDFGKPDSGCTEIEIGR